MGLRGPFRRFSPGSLAVPAVSCTKSTEMERVLKYWMILQHWGPPGFPHLYHHKRISLDHGQPNNNIAPDTRSAWIQARGQPRGGPLGGISWQWCRPGAGLNNA